MASFNNVQFAGNCTRDPELKEVGSTKLCKFGLAVTETYKGEKKTMFFDVEVWGAQADAVSKYVTKGSPVLVAGKLKMNEWMDNAGAKRVTPVVVANQVVFLSSKRSDSEDQAPMPFNKNREHIEKMDPNTGQALMDFDALPF
jgi:single-strand DNA-binding protein